MIDIGECRLCQRAQGLAFDHDQHLRPTNRFQPYAVAGELAIRAAVLAERKERRVPIRRQSDVNGRVHFMLQVPYPILLAYLAVDPLDRAELFT